MKVSLFTALALKILIRGDFLFIGPTQSGKSSMARIWYDSKAKVMNDDRMVIREIENRFYIFGTPWHGNFSEYFKSYLDKAELKRVFFIYHDSKNKINKIKSKEAFKHLYPNIFPVFWNKEDLEKQIDLCNKLTSLVPSYRLGFKKDKSVISAVRSIC